MVLARPCMSPTAPALQSRGDKVVEIGAGDVVWTPPGEWHDGAAPDRFMTHLSITDTVPGPEWGEHVTDDEYRGR